MNKVSHYLKSSFDEIVFDGRNKLYGSFLLRGLVRRHTMIGLVTCSCLTIFSIACYYTDFGRSSKDIIQDFAEVQISLSEPPPIIDVMPPAVPPAMAPKQMTEYTEMEVRNDEEVADNQELTNSTKPIDSTSTGTATEGSNVNSLINGDGDAVYSNVDVAPEYPGGSKGLRKYLSDNVRYPETAKNNGITGTVWVVFIVNQDGSVSDVKIEKGIGGGCDQEAIRVVEGMRKWKPGLRHGQPVRVVQRLKIGFSLDENA